MSDKFILNASPIILLGKADLLKTISPLAKSWIIHKKEIGTGELCMINSIDGCKFGENITGESSFGFRVEKNGCELRLERYFWRG